MNQPRTPDEVRACVARTLHLGLGDALDAGPGWPRRIQEWADWIHQQYAPLIVGQGVTTRQFGCCDLADDLDEPNTVGVAVTGEEEAREDAASWATGRLVYRDVTYGPWRFTN